MRRWLSFLTLVAVLVPNLVLAQGVQPALVTLKQPLQPSGGQALPGATLAAVAVTISSNTVVHVTGIRVQKVGSANNAAIAGLQVNTDQATVVGQANGFDANNSVTIPITATINGATIFLVSAVMASSLTPYAGQSFELNITGVTTDAVSQSGVLPVYGPQFLITTGVAKPTCTISANASSFTVGQTINVSWRSTNATGGTITGIGNVGPSGLQGILPGGQSQTLVGTFTGPGGTGTCSLTLTLTSSSGGTVSSAQSGTGDFGSTNGGTVTPGVTAGSTGGGSPGAQNGSGTRGVGDVCTADSKNGINCQLCSLVPLVQNIINFGVGFSILLAAVGFAYAGILYFTSAANPTGVTKAKKIFGSVFLGLVVVLTAWIIIQTLLNALVSKNFFTNGSWNSLQCVPDSQRPGTILPDASGRGGNTTNLNTFFGSVGGGITNTGGGSGTGGFGVATGVVTGDTSASFNDRFGSTPTCPNSYSYAAVSGQCISADGNNSVNPTYVANTNTSGFPTGVTGNSGAGTTQWASSLSTYCQQAELDDSECKLARAIMANESSGRPGIISSAQCVGLMQVCPSTACNIDPTVDGCSSGNMALVTQALLDPNTNMRLGTDLIGTLSDKCNGEEACIAASYNAGFGATRPSTSCVGQSVWECNANPGYRETRTYVPRVLNTYNNL